MPHQKGTRVYVVWYYGTTYAGDRVGGGSCLQEKLYNLRMTLLGSLEAETSTISGMERKVLCWLLNQNKSFESFSIRAGHLRFHEWRIQKEDDLQIKIARAQSWKL